MVKISKTYIPKETEKYMCEKHLAFFKKKLLDWKIELKRSSNEALFNSSLDDNSTSADIATWPWIARHEWHDIGLNKFESLSKWYMNIAERDAVVKGYNFMGAGEIPKP